MADSRTLNILIEAKNNASRELDGLKGKVQSLQPTFTKMAAVGTAAMAGISVGIYKTVQAAAENEGALNKFNTVFGEYATEMQAWVEDIRKSLPSATTDVIKMASGIQDLLIPMGFARDEAMGMTQETLELANALAAFNDVPVEQVLDAMISGFSGMTRPLKQFGIDVPVERLQAMAIEQGIISKNFNELDFETRRTVQAQLMLEAAYADSSDALAGFDVNQDSFIRRQQELKASIEDTKNAIGDAFLPIVDSLLKKLLPLVQKFKDWAEENPELIATITKIALGLAAIVTVVGVVGLVLPKIITGFILLGKAFMFVIQIFPLIMKGMAALGGPITLIIAAVAILAYVIYKNWDDIKRWTIETYTAVSKFLTETWNGIKDFLTVLWESMKLSVTTTWTAIRDFFTETWNNLKETVTTVLTAIKEFFVTTWDNIRSYFIEKLENIKSNFTIIWTAIKDFFTSTLQLIRDIFVKAWDEIKSFFEERLNNIKENFIYIWNAVKDFFTDTLQKIKETFVNIWTEIKDFFEERLNNIKDTFISIWDAIKDFFFNWLDNVKANFINIWDSIKTFFLAWLDTVKTTYITIWDAIKDFFFAWLDNVKTNFTNQWNAIKDFFLNLLNIIKTTFTNVWDAISSFFTNTLNNIKNIFINTWEAIKNFLNNTLEDIKRYVTNAARKIESIFNTYRSVIVGAWQSIWNAVKQALVSAIVHIKAPIMGVVNWLRDKLSAVRNFVRSIFSARASANSVSTSYSSSGSSAGYATQKPVYGPTQVHQHVGRANGGPVTQGNPYMIGEKGPEMFVPNSSGKIIPNHKLGGRGGLVFNITVNGDISGEDLIEKVSQGIIRNLSFNSNVNI